jgi:hypothetical protein
MHGRAPSEYLRGKERQRGILAAIRQHLKKANYHNFISFYLLSPVSAGKKNLFKKM